MQHMQVRKNNLQRWIVSQMRVCTFNHGLSFQQSTTSVRLEHTVTLTVFKTNGRITIEGSNEIRMYVSQGWGFVFHYGHTFHEVTSTPDRLLPDLKIITHFKKIVNKERKKIRQFSGQGVPAGTTYDWLFVLLHLICVIYSFFVFFFRGRPRPNLT